MDQDAFRQLLSTSRQSQPNSKRAIPTSKPQQAPTSASSEPEFKPRKVKKAESRYRDRAAERREGTGNDYADIEAVLEDFEKRVAHEDKEAIEEKRKYLGGDSQHTILVKGLDMSLLEQNRARAATSVEDDEILEQAFTEATSITEPIETRKRTREDIIRELKSKRQNKDKSTDQPPVENDKSTLEEAKNAGKFRPIGSKPTKPTDKKSKKRRVKDGKEGVKKKQKMESTPVRSEIDIKLAKETPVVSHDQERHDPTMPSSSRTPQKPPEPETAPLDEDLDIFAGAGDYDGFPDDDSEGEYLDTTVSAAQGAASALPAISTKGWFGESEPEVRQPSIPPDKSPPIPEAEEEPQEVRLRPLESSTLPSIRDFLAMDEAVEKAEKRKARKEKKKKKKKADGDDDD